MAHPIRIGAIAGEYMETVVVTEWCAAEGDVVRKGDVLLVVETAKAATEVPCPSDGVLTRIDVGAGEEVPVSSVLGLIGVDADDNEVSSASSGDVDAEGQVRGSTPVAAAGPAPTAEAARSVAIEDAGRIVASPWAKSRARDLGVDLQAVRATSPSGRIKARDVEAAACNVNAQYEAKALSGPLNVVRLNKGEGTPLVLIHGFAADANAWRPLLRVMRVRPAFGIELPAHGDSPRAVPRDFAALARQVTEAFDSLRLDRAHVAGHSLGGAAALALADIRSRKIASVTLISPGGLGPDIGGESIAGLARANAPESFGPWLRRLAREPAIIDDAYVNAAWSLRADPELRAAQLELANSLFPDGTPAFDLRAAFERLEVPARIVWGRADAVLPWKHGIGAPSHVGLHLLEGVGHMPQVEAPEQVARIMVEMMTASEQGAAT